ncbi:MAG: tetratricopeptide repeat protein [Nitrospirae bacterium]|nr:tetratricopeptide repeat protein [Nitrospirota bacterium]
MNRVLTSRCCWPYVLLSLLIGVASCGKKEKSPTPEAPPPAASLEGAPSDPRIAKAMEEVVAYKVRVDKDPKDVEALAAMGNVNLSLGRFDHAKEWYERALKVDPNRTDTRMDLALSLRYLKKPDEAIAELKRVLAKDPKNARALYNLGVILFEDKKDKQGAIARWEALMNAHPDYPQTAQLRQVVESIKHPSSLPPASPPPGG